MSPRAILRRQCIRAMRTLIRRWPKQYEEESFEISDGVNHDELAGTPIYWEPPDYFGESGCRPAVEELRHIIAVESTDWSAASHEIELRERYAAMRVNPELFRRESADTPSDKEPK